MLACPATVCWPYSWLSTTFTTRGCACVSSIGMNYKPKGAHEAPQEEETVQPLPAQGLLPP